MKTEKYIDNYIEEQLKIELNPYLTTQIMAKLENEPHNNLFNLSGIQKLGIIFSVAASIMAGVILGTNYTSDTSTSLSININDSSIENFQMFYDNDEFQE
jgi:hypothetical protein